MKNIIQNLLLLGILLIGVSAKGQTCDPNADRQQLINFYWATDGQNWDIPWDLTMPMNTWLGVQTNADGCVVCIDLDGISDCLVNNSNGNGLKGNIIDLKDIYLPHLTFLSISNNNLIGQIPDFTGLPKLEFLSLSSNYMIGTIPDFTGLPNLKTLLCEKCNLSGTLKDFTNLPKLEHFRVPWNDLQGDLIDFQNTPNLRLYICFNNSLSGEIPNFENLSNLRSLNCAENNLSGEIPNFEYLPNLYSFDCGENDLEGKIPEFLNSFNLTYFKCDNNILSEGLPMFKHLQNLLLFWCNDNDLEGCYPDYVCNINFNSSNNIDLFWEGDHNPFCNNMGGGCVVEGGVLCCDPIPVEDITIECIGDDLIICLPQIVGCDPLPFYPNPVTYYAELIPNINGALVPSQTIQSSPLIPNLSPNSPNCITVTDGDGYDSSLEYEIRVFYYADCDGGNVPDDIVYSTGNVTFEENNCIGDPENCCDIQMIINPLGCGSFEICLDPSNASCDIVFFGDFRGNIHPSMISNPSPGFPTSCLTISGYSAGAIADFTFITEVEGCGQIWHQVYYEFEPCGATNDNSNYGLVYNDNNNGTNASVPQITPNPFNNNFQIHFSSELSEAYQLAIYNLQGKEVFTSNGNFDKGNNTISINQLSNMPSGIYYYMLKTNTNQFSDKIVKF